MKLKILQSLLLFYFLFITEFSFCQNPLEKQWDSRYGGTNNDDIISLYQTSDGGYILGGYSYSGIGGDKTQPSWGGSDYWIVKTDSVGNFQWDKRFGGTDDDYLTSIQQTSDGGYILGGYSESGIGGNKTQSSWGGEDYWIVKTDSSGNFQWDKRFGGLGEDRLMSLQQTSDQGYLFGGFSYSGINGDKTQPSWGLCDYWVVKTDSFGNFQWDKRFGGTSFDNLFSLHQTTDNGFILGGHSISGMNGDKTQPSWGYFDYWIVKIDSLGNFQWDRRFGGISDDDLYSIQQTIDGGYILGGNSNSGISGDKTQASWGSRDYWIVKTDSLGNMLWDKRFGGSDDEAAFGIIVLTFDNGYLISGSSYSTISGDKTENNLGTEQTWIVKTNSLGIKQWDKTIFTTGQDVTGYAVETNDGCYVIGNYTLAGTGGYKTEVSWSGSNDYWIIRFCDTSKTAASFITSPTSFCQSSCLSFIDQSTNNPVSWQWLFPGASPSTFSLQNPTNICYNTPGMYDVTLMVSNAYGSDTLTLTNYITVYPTPSPPIIVESNDTLYSSAASAYQWFTNGNALNGATNFFYTPSAEGYYTVVISDSNSCLAMDSIYFLFYPVSDLSANDTSVCEKFCIDFFDQSLYSPTWWQWLFPGGNPSSSTLQNPAQICYQTPGVFDVTLITTNSNGNDTVTLTNYITVYPTPPFPAITQNGYTLTSSPAISYQWQFNSVDIPGATSQSYDVQQSGYYTVFITDQNGCVSSTTTYILIDGIEDVNSGADVLVYPNPSNGNFIVDLLNSQIGDVLKIKIYNTLGQEIFSSEEKITSAQWKKEIHMSSTPQGVYFLGVKNSFGFEQTKIIVTN
jgi:PKD repeat protein